MLSTSCTWMNLNLLCTTKYVISAKFKGPIGLIGLHCTRLARLLPGYAASKSSKQSIRGRWTPFTYIAACRKTSVVS